MSRLLPLSAALLLAFVSTAFAHGPTPQKVEETIAIKAPPDVVWKVVKDFAGLSGWHAAVASCAGEGGNGNGAMRTFTLKSGGELVDSLDEYDEAAKSYSYRLAKENVEAFPVSFYSDTLTVKAAGDGSEVEWIGRFYRGDTGNYPPATLDDEAAMAAMQNFFRDGLASLKRKVESTR
ncbi:MAG TPA: SRPBCC family protein [Tardiphaga sp.]